MRLGLEYVTGATALVGGLLLASRPDGAWLQARRSALAGSPFTDWRVPGVLLAVLVGGGFLGAAEWQRHDCRHSRGLSIVAGVGLIIFEGSELVWIGFHPLEVVFGVVGVTVVILAIRSSAAPTRPARSEGRSDRLARTAGGQDPCAR